MLFEIAPATNEITTCIVLTLDGFVRGHYNVFSGRNHVML